MNTPEREPESFHRRLDELLNSLLEQVDAQMRDSLRAEIEKSPVLAKAKQEGGTFVLLHMPTSQVESLSDREKQVATLAGEGFKNDTIALKLGISSATVAAHLRKIFKKLNVTSRTELAYKIMALA